MAVVSIESFDGLVKIEDTGRVLIPAPVRKKLGVGLGDVVRLTVRGGEVVIRPVTPTCYHCGVEIEQDELLREYRICRKCLESVREHLIEQIV